MSTFICLFLTLFIAAEDHHHHHHQKSFKKAEEWAKEFDDPSRDEWQKPKELIDALGIKADAVIADLGAGTGYFSVRLAKQFPKATVYGIDNEKTMVAYLQKRAEQEKIKNLIPILATNDGFTVEKKIDLLLVVDTYHHIPAREKYFAQILPLLKEDARIVIVDFLPNSPIGPPKKYRFQPPQIEKELLATGFKTEKVLTWPRQFVLFLKRDTKPSP